MHPDYSTDPQGPDSDFGKALIQAMDDFTHSTTAPAFDSEAIVRRTRRRRGVLVLTASAAVVAAVVTLTVTLDSAPEPAAAAAAAASSAKPQASPVVTSASPVHFGPAGCMASWPSPTDTPQRSVAVPDLTGMGQSQAAAALAAAGLESSLTHVGESLAKSFLNPAHANLIGSDGNIVAGTVVCTSPNAGTRVAPGDFVSLFVVQY